jgi:glucose/mannose transport system substrate-binding protein
MRDIEEMRPGTLESLDTLVDGLGLRPLIFPESLAAGTVANRNVGMPVNAHRANAMFYNKAIFAAQHLTPPTTMPEFMAVCRALRAAGITPVATAYQGWILRIMFQSIVAGQMGSRAYNDHVTGKSTSGLPRLREAIGIFAEVLARYANPDAAEEGFNWTNAAQTLYNGDAAMFFHGDWAKGYFLQLGWRPGIDFGVMGAPGTSDLFVYVTDLFTIPKGAGNTRGARDFLTTVASVAGQTAFNRIKGSSPIRKDVPGRALDTLGETTLNDLAHARIRLSDPNDESYDRALMKFTVDKDAEALLQVFSVVPLR